MQPEMLMDWDKWLLEKEDELKQLGYSKYIQGIKSEDFAYWKTIYLRSRKVYQVGLLFYDFRKYSERDPSANRISIQYECHILCDNRIDLSVSKPIEVNEFEAMAGTFYRSMRKYL